MSPQETRFQARAAEALAAPKFRLRHLLPFIGPSFIASVAYMDPGNFATNISGGARYGFALLWVILAANLAAMFIQYLSAKLGLVTGLNLPQLIRQETSKPVAYFYWIQGEIVAMATDLAEFLGAALAIHLLAGLTLFEGALVAGVASYALLALQRFGFRPLEAAITVLVGVIAVCYLVELFLVQPSMEFWTGFVPGFQEPGMLYIAVGILGATVMPHVIYLHSALTQNRIPSRGPADTRKMLNFTKVEIVFALGIAGLINMAMLAAASAAFFGKGMQNGGDLTVAYQTLVPLLGPLAGGAFAIALLASGLSSSSVGTMSGQVVMEGFTSLKLPVWIRRLVTMVPAFVVIGLGADPTQSLILSQVVLSFGIPFAVIPLLLYTSRARIMGAFANKIPTRLAGAVIVGLIVGLNFWLLYQVATG
ncbi:MAG: Nramp family divalent metal transporter [Spirochaetales bacterium]